MYFSVVSTYRFLLKVTPNPTLKRAEINKPTQEIIVFSRPPYLSRPYLPTCKRSHGSGCLHFRAAPGHKALPRHLDPGVAVLGAPHLPARQAAAAAFPRPSAPGPSTPPLSRGALPARSLGAPEPPRRREGRPSPRHAPHLGLGAAGPTEGAALPTLRACARRRAGPLEHVF